MAADTKNRGFVSTQCFLRVIGRHARAQYVCMFCVCVWGGVRAPPMRRTCPRRWLPCSAQVAWSPEAVERALDMFYDPASGGISWARFMQFGATRGGMCLQHRGLICPLCVVIRECAYPQCPCMQYTETTVAQHEGFVRGARGCWPAAAPLDATTGADVQLHAPPIAPRAEQRDARHGGVLAAAGAPRAHPRRGPGRVPAGPARGRPAPVPPPGRTCDVCCETSGAP